MSKIINYRSRLNPGARSYGLHIAAGWWFAVSSTGSGRWIVDLWLANRRRTWIGYPARPWTYRSCP